jgi:hypothetical protein
LANAIRVGRGERMLEIAVVGEAAAAVEIGI